MKLNKALIIYGFAACLFLTIVGIFSAQNISQLLSSFIFLPLVFLFATKIFHSPSQNNIKSKTVNPISAQNEIPAVVQNISPLQPEIFPRVADKNKRLFLKLIGSTSFTILLMSLFTKKAQASFFGSVPGPGVVSIKNIAGNKIDPAEKNPTDGYAITNIDNATYPYYYGFINKTGGWYIMSEDASGEYLYAKGTTDFTTNWNNRKTTLSYGYFNAIFG